MKKLTTLLLAAGLVFAASAPASAVDIKMDGEYKIQFTKRDNSDYTKDFGNESEDKAHQRVRIGMTASVSENLSGYFQIDSKWQWGANDDKATVATDTAFDGAKIDVRAYSAYIDWTVPSTPVKVRMGRHKISTPSQANGKSMVLHAKDPVDGITISAPVTDWASLTGFWGRYDKDNVTDTALGSEFDVFGLVADLKFNGIQVSPWALYVSISGDAMGGSGWDNNNIDLLGEGDGYVAGISGTINMFNPFVAKFGFAYGNRSFAQNNAVGKLDDQNGWYADASVSYKTAYGTPALTAWYATGDDKDDYKGQGHLPSIAARNGISTGFFNGSGLLDSELNNYHCLQGTWGVKAAVSGISFLEGLTHELAVIYAAGTNDKAHADATPAKYLTEEDSIVEIDFNTNYQIYKNLGVLFELAYVIENFDEDLKNSNGAKIRGEFDNAWRAGVCFTYKF